MRLTAAVAAAAALAVLCTGCGSSRSAAATRTPASAGSGGFEGTAIPAGAPAADFALRDQDGRLVRLSAQRGKYVFVAFLYTHCVDVCPLIAQWLSNAVRSLGPHADEARILAVSVDPKGDTQAAVRAYVRSHHLVPQFHWLTGTRTQLAPVWQGYNILVEARSPDRIAHSAPVFLLDRSGRPHLFYAPPQNGQEFRHDLQRLLQS